jgi:hypothetical protein
MRQIVVMDENGNPEVRFVPCINKDTFNILAEGALNEVFIDPKGKHPDHGKTKGQIMMAALADRAMGGDVKAAAFFREAIAGKVSSVGKAQTPLESAYEEYLRRVGEKQKAQAVEVVEASEDRADRADRTDEIPDFLRMDTPDE